MKVRRLFLPVSLTFAFGLSILLAACAASGSGAAVATTPTAASKQSSAPTSATAPPPAAERAAATQPAAEGGEIKEIKVMIKNNTFPEEIRVKAGARVVFVVTNQADEKHSFEVPDMGVYQEISAGQTTRIEWTVPDRKGKWDMGCFLTDPPDVHERMEGNLVIE